MKKKTQAMRKVATLLLGIAICLPSAARAEKERKSPLTDAPVIRKRVELRDKRFELGVGAGVSVSQDFYNALLIMPKLAFHFTDWLSLAAVGGFNLTKGWKSSFNSDLNGALSSDNTSSRSPSVADATATMNHITYVGMGQLEFVPLSGKIALLSALFTYFDFYLLLGGGIVGLEATGARPPACEPDDPNAKPKCDATKGSKLAINFGAGVHAFLGRWAAVNLEIRDLYYKNNASGRDVNGDKKVDDRDQGWTNNYVFNLNFQFFFPTTAKISR